MTGRHVPVSTIAFAGLLAGCGQQQGMTGFDEFGPIADTAWVAYRFSDGSEWQELVVSSAPELCERMQLAAAEELAFQQGYQAWTQEEFADTEEACEAYLDLATAYVSATLERNPPQSAELVLDSAGQFRDQEKFYEGPHDYFLGGTATVQPERPYQLDVLELYEQTDCAQVESVSDIIADASDLVQAAWERNQDEPGHGMWTLEEGLLRLSFVDDGDSLRAELSASLSPTSDQWAEAELEASFEATTCPVQL